jgi:hypothetical protein
VLQELTERARPDIYWFAIPNAARRSPRLAAKLKAEGLRSGVADLCIMLPGGRVGWLELKTLTGKQSLEQKGFEARCIRLGHPYEVVRTVASAIDVLTNWKVLR